MANKMKVVDKFSAIKGMLNGETVEGFSVAEALEFLDERIAITERKNANDGEKKPTKTQLENEDIKKRITEALSGVEAPGLTIGEIGKAIGIESNQKVSALVTQMLTIRKGVPNPAGTVVRTEIKGKAHFALAE